MCNTTYNDNNFIFSWHKLTVLASRNIGIWKKSQEQNMILDQVTGQARNGSLVAIMGPSGAGKTTLISTLSGKITNMTGDLTLNNKILSSTEVKNISGFLHQHFVAVDSLTVQEHLNFMNALMLPNKPNTKYPCVSSLISELNLEQCINSSIRHLSGGEKKKLGLAVELLGDPLIIFCDEPTTGLDSFSAMSVTDMLAKYAHCGKLVIATIHQPSAQLYDCFDEVILLNKGKLVHQGTKTETHEFFKNLHVEIPKTPYNLADFYIHTIAKLDTNKLNLPRLDIDNEKVDCVYDSSSRDILQCNMEVSSTNKRNLFLELYWLLWRNCIDTKRNLNRQAGYFGLLVVTAFIISSLYSDVKEDENSVQNYKGLLFFVTSELIFTHLYAVIYTFPEEVNVFLCEESLYSSYAYFISKLMAVVPRCIIYPLVFMLIVYTQVNFLDTFLLLLKMCCILSIGCISATAFGLCVSAVFQSLEVIELFIMPLDLLSMLMAGILIKISTISLYFQWLKYTSPFYFVYESLSILKWNNITKIACSNKTSLPCYNNGVDVLEGLGFHSDYSYVFVNVFGLCMLSIGFCIIGYLGICRKRKCLL